MSCHFSADCLPEYPIFLIATISLVTVLRAWKKHKNEIKIFSKAYNGLSLELYPQETDTVSELQ